MTKLAIPDLLRVVPGTRPRLARIDPAATPGFEGDKAAAEERLKALRDELAAFQERLWAQAGQSLLVVLQALDGGGKDGLIRKVITAFNPQGTRGYRDLAAAEILVAAARQMDPKWPKVEEDLSKVVIPE